MAAALRARAQLGKRERREIGFEQSALLVPQVLDLVERALQRAVTGCHEPRVLLRHRLESLLHLLELCGVLLPLARELTEQPEDLARRALELEVVDGLTDDGEHRVQRQR